MHRALAVQDLTDLAVALPKLEAGLGRGAIRQAGFQDGLLPNELLGNPIQGSSVGDLFLVVVGRDFGSFHLFSSIEGRLDGSSSAGSGGEESDEEELHGTFFGCLPLGDGSDEV